MFLGSSPQVSELVQAWGPTHIHAGRTPFSPSLDFCLSPHQQTVGSGRLPPPPQLSVQWLKQRIFSCEPAPPQAFTECSRPEACPLSFVFPLYQVPAHSTRHQVDPQLAPHSPTSPKPLCSPHPSTLASPAPSSQQQREWSTEAQSRVDCLSLLRGLW